MSTAGNSSGLPERSSDPRAATEPDSPPAIRGILESALYCSDLSAAERFYADVLGLELLAADRGRHLFFRMDEAMLLIFNPDATKEGFTDDDNQSVGPHGAWGDGHVAFRASEEEIDAWRAHLEGHGVEIEQEINWQQGGRSIYFRDPDGNSLEFATPQLWGLPATEQG